jgi:hypothetical protein
MSYVYIIVALVAILTALACYAFISQQMEKKRKQRLRLIKALQQRLSLFKQIVTGIPAGYLPSELSALVRQTLLSTLEQLTSLADKDQKANYEAQASEIQDLLNASTNMSERPRLTPEQTTQVQPLLKELARFIGAQTENGRIPRVKASNLLGKCRKLLLQSTIEGYISQGKKAHAEQKLRLAIHHYTTARKLLLKEAGKQDVSKQIAQLSAAIKKLEQENIAQGAPAEPPAPEAASKEWEELEEADDWKKKQVYD